MVTRPFTALLAASLPLFACGEDSDDSLGVRDPALPASVHEAFADRLFPRQYSGGLPVGGSRAPNFELVSTSTGTSPDDLVPIATPTDVSVSTDGLVRLSFYLDSVDSEATLESRAKVVGHEEHLGRIIARSSLSSDGSWELLLDFDDVFGVGFFDLDVTFAALADDRLLGAAPRTRLRFTLTSPTADPQDLTAGIPSRFVSTFASCGSTSTVTVSRFAYDVDTSRCFFVRNRARFDCDRCDDFGVDACARRACSP